MTHSNNSSRAFLGPLRGAGLLVIHHDVGVDIAVAGMTEAGQLQAVLFLQLGGKFEQRLQLSARHHNILVELGQAGVPERVGKLAADLPDGLALLLAPKPRSTKSGCWPRTSFSTTPISWRDGFLLSIQLHNEMGLAAEQAPAARAPGGGGQREFIGQFRRARQEAAGKDRLQRAHGAVHGGKPHGQIGPEWRQRN